MRSSSWFVSLVLVAGLGESSAPARLLTPLTPNPNTAPAGTLRNGTLTLNLEITEASWHKEGGKLILPRLEAFAERGKSPLMPGPLIRVPAGTMVRVSLRNTLSKPVTFFLPTSPSTDDSIVVAGGATGELAVRASKPGNFIYRATAAKDKVTEFFRMSGALGGALVVDSAAPARALRDRVMVIIMVPDSATVAGGFSANTVIAFSINGRAWPNTERLSATVGDSLHWRVINATWDVHPMHLHGFYYRVDEFTGLYAATEEQGDAGRMVVTERMSGFSAMSMTWVPERAGNWLMHCHFSAHLEPPGPPMKMDLHENHALTGMVGLVMGINVAPRRSAVAETAPKAARQLRLIAESDAGYPDSMPSWRFAIEEKGKRTTAHVGISPVLYLTRNEAVAITVVNRLSEPTAVHWHGMELQSYYDGVAGLSGTPGRLAPMIAPGDSFVARFTPPRAGTFMYHSHANDVRQQAAGLVGAMIVRDGAPASKQDDFEFMFKGARDGLVTDYALQINGQPNPDTIIVHAGKPVRLRFMSLATFNPDPAVMLTARRDSVQKLPRDSLLVRWLPVAKDGAELPAKSRRQSAARQIVSMGETYDFEFTPTARGQQLRIEVRSPGGVLFARVPVRVE